jgi:hypothetical protein
MPQQREPDHTEEGRKEKFIDEDRMVSEGMGGGYIMDRDNAYIGDSTVETMDKPESVVKARGKE